MSYFDSQYFIFFLSNPYLLLCIKDFLEKPVVTYSESLAVEGFRPLVIYSFRITFYVWLELAVTASSTNSI